MKKICLWLVAVAIVVGLGVFIGLRSLGPGDTEQADDARGPEPEKTTPGHPSTEAQDAGTAAESTPVEETAPCAVAGTIVDADGQPVVDAEVILLVVPFTDETVRRTATDPTGRFRFDEVTRGRIVLVVKRPPLGAPWPLGTIDPAEKSGEELTELTFTLEKPVTWQVKVQDNQKQPLAGALVAARSRNIEDIDVRKHPAVVGCELQTDENGAVTFTPLAQGRYDLVVTLNGYATAIKLFACQADQAQDKPMLITLEAGASIAGTVLDPESRPATGATVACYAQKRYHYLQSDTPLATTACDTAGRFRLADLPPGRHLLVASSDRFSNGYLGVRLAAGQQRAGCRISLEPAKRLEGRVMGAGQGPIEGAAVTIERYSPDSTAGRSGRRARWTSRDIDVAEVTSGPDGRFCFEKAPTKDAWVTAWKEGYRSSDGQDVSSDKPITLVLIPGPVITGIVTVAETGKPVEEATVYCLSDYDRAETDAQGRYTLTDVSPGRQTFVAHAPGLASPTLVKASVARAGTTELNFVLEPARPITGVVTDAQTGTPVEGASVSARCKRPSQRTSRWGEYFDKYEDPFHWGGPFGASTDEHGAFEIPVSMPEMAALVVEAQDYLEERVELEGRDLAQPLQVQIKRGAVVAGRVLAPNGEPVAGAKVTCQQTAEDPDVRHVSYRHSGSGERETGENGEFRVGGLKPGTYLLTATHEEFASGKCGPFELPADQALEGVDVVLTVGGRISGLVTDETGAPIEESTVSFSAGAEEDDETSSPPRRSKVSRVRSGSETESATTDVDGHYVSSPLQPGTYNVSAASPRTCAEPQRVVVTAGATVGHVNFVLQPGLEISGRVINEDGEPIAKATLETWDAGEQLTVETEDDGTFVMAGLEPGEVDVSTSAKGYISDQTECTAPASDITITLERGGTIIGRVVDKLTQQPVEVFGLTFNEYEAYDRPEMEYHPEGRFELDGLDPSDGVVVVVVAEGYAPASSPPVKTEKGVTSPELTIELVEGAALTLTVVAAADGRPVPDVTITSDELIEDDETTDAEGRCVIEHLAIGRCVFELDHEAFAPKRVRLEIKEGETRKDIRVALDTGATVRGRVVAKATQQPIVGAHVMLWEPGTETWEAGDPDCVDMKTQTDPDGQFELTCVLPGRCLLSVQHADFAPFQQARGIETGEGEPLLIELCAGGRVVGTVTDTNGIPLREVQVAAIWSLRQAFDADELGVKTDELGNYAIDKLTPGRYRIIAAVGGRAMLFGARQAESKQVVVRDGRETRVDFVLGGGAAVFGQITRAGHPVARGVVVVLPNQEGPAGMLFGGSARGEIDETGQYRVEGVKPGAYKIMIWIPDERNGVRDFTMGTTDLRLDIELGTVCLTGTVYGELSQPLEGAQISLAAEPKGDGDKPGYLEIWSLFSGSATTDATGNFSVDCDQPGTYRLYVTADGYASQIIPIEKRPRHDVAPLRVQLEKACTVQGTVRTETDELPDEMVVFLLDEQGRLLTGGEPDIDSDTGEWEIDNAGPGRYTIVAKAMGYAPVRQEITVTRGRDTTVNLELDEGHELAVTIRDETGRVVPGARIALETGDDPIASAALSMIATMEREMSVSRGTGTEGEIVLPFIAEGDYTLRVHADGYESATTKVRVTKTPGNVSVTLKRSKKTDH